MSVARAAVRSAILEGIDGHRVTVEVHISPGLPGYTVVGLPDAAVRESRDRVRAAMLSSSIPFPNRKVTIGLAPSALRKTGSGLDLAIAIGLCALDEAFPIPDARLAGVGVLGELGLDGRVRPIPGVLACVDTLARAGIREVVVPQANAREAALVPDVTVRVATTLRETWGALRGEHAWPSLPPVAPATAPPTLDDIGDLADVRGLALAQQALSVAAAGNHHFLMIGPPGAGKTMLARRVSTILPGLTDAEALEVTRVHSVVTRGGITDLCSERPFRAPHHAISTPALVGGGTGRVQPGEVTLAHRGALFLDELGEFPPSAIEALRQPLEEGVVRISRLGGTRAFPARFLLIACSNPCPCGMGAAKCRCSESARARYLRRLSAPLLDRFDLRLWISPPGAREPHGRSSAEARAEVERAVTRQRARFEGAPWNRNGDVPSQAFDAFLPLTADALDAWKTTCEVRDLSGRGAARVRRVARTLADLADRDTILPEDIALAATMREDIEP